MLGAVICIIKILKLNERAVSKITISPIRKRALDAYHSNPSPAKRRVLDAYYKKHELNKCKKRQIYKDRKDEY